MLKKPLVSVIIPTYNRAIYLGSAIESVISQSYKNIEIIIVDDNSKDNSAEIINSFKDNRINYIKRLDKKNVAAARNHGLRESKGVYLSFLDSDDILMPFAIEKLVEAMENNRDWGMAYSNFTAFGENVPISLQKLSHSKNKKQGYIFNDLLMGNFIACLGILIKKDCLDAVGWFDEDDNVIEDYELFLRIAFKYRIGYLGEVLGRYRFHSTNFCNDAIRLKKRLLNVLTKIDEKTGAIKLDYKNKIQSKMYANIAIEYMKLNDPVSKNYIKKAIAFYPRSCYLWILFIFAKFVPRLGFELYKLYHKLSLKFINVVK